MRYDGKVVIVTGGGSGIGEATVRRFAQEGASVVVADNRAEAMRGVLAAIGGEGRHLGVVVDVIDPDAIGRMIDDTMARFGRLDTLVNNAGMGSFGKVTDIDLDHWNTVMAVDVASIFWASRQAMPHLVATGGSIVNVASASGMAADYGFAAYNAAKAAVLNLTRAMAIDHAPAVRVNAVSPGLTATPLATGLTGNPAIMQAYDGVLPMARPARPDEIASAIAFLASDDASYVNGHNLVIDGGMTAHTGQPHFTKLLGGDSHLAGADTAVR
ncbi:SDR family NAD(P)-dependent oxidoreductase [Sphingomonas adhaesiva]|uniref:SDR family NAD(P)-dependent oxidoreductase n=1 Tax=Sphingomonas adhaesiva TaxID=28212 RepID=UPI002FFBF18F